MARFTLAAIVSPKTTRPPMVYSHTLTGVPINRTLMGETCRRVVAGFTVLSANITKR